jgi:hypothetical protein
VKDKNYFQNIVADIIEEALTMNWDLVLWGYFVDFNSWWVHPVAICEK